MNTALRFAKGSAVGESGYVYVDRLEDQAFLHLARKTGFFTVSGCHAMGKTSLVKRWRRTLEAEGLTVALIDLRALGKPETLHEWLSLLNGELAILLPGYSRISAKHIRTWAPGRTLLSLFTAARQSSSGRILLVFDEIDWIQDLKYCTQILAALAACQTDVVDQDSGLAICLMGLRLVSEFEPRSGDPPSPLGAGIKMRDFENNHESVQAICQGFAADLDENEAKRIAGYLLEQTGGQPFLTMSLADDIIAQNLHSLEEVTASIDVYVTSQRQRKRDLFLQIEDFFLIDDGKPEYALRTPEYALRTYDALLRREPIALAPSADGAQLLLLSGLVRESAGILQEKGPLFRKCFDGTWALGMLNRVPRERDTRGRHKQPVLGGRPRICVFNTGGTIGMVRRGNKVVPSRDEREFFENYGAIQAIADIDFEQPFKPLDSINITPAHWTTIATEIYKRRDRGYAGFVVAHGTDTMSFTASAVAFALGENLPFPVVFTGAQATPDVRHGDAQLNLLRACLVAAKPIPEVVVCFGNHVFRAVRSQKRDERRFEGFESVVYPPLAEITEMIEVDDERLRRFEEHPIKVHLDRLRTRADAGAKFELSAEFATGILLIQLTPGLEPEFYRQALNARVGSRSLCNGVIIQTLGAGNVTTIDPYGFMSFIGDALRKVPVLITSPYPWRPTMEFAPAAAAVDLGAIPGGEMTAAAAVTKFRWVLAKTSRLARTDRHKEIERLMKEDLIGELTSREDLQGSTTTSALREATA